MPKLQLNSGRWSITIPKDLVNLKGRKLAQNLAVILNEKGNLEVIDIEQAQELARGEKK